MEEFNAIEIEGIDYVIANEVELNGTKYIHLAEIKNPKNFCIRKIVLIDGREMLAGLDNEQEFDAAFKALVEKIVIN